MKELKKIIALFLMIFVIGSTVIVVSVNQKLNSDQIKKTEEISKDSNKSKSKEYKRV